MSADTTKVETTDIADAPLISFCQLLRTLQYATGKRLGYDLAPADEPIRLRADLNAHFPVNELARWHKQAKLLDVSFFGLFGPCGALPQHYTQKMVQQALVKDFAMRDFLDMFNHRLLSYFYRAWEKHQFPIAFETAAAADAEDALTKGLWALLGMRGLADRGRLHVSDSAFLFYAGQMSNRRATGDGLRITLQHAFGVGVRIDQFVGQWMFLVADAPSRMGSSPTGQSLGNRLGVDSVLGSRIWDNQNKFRICLGPVVWDRFQALNPLSEQLRKISDFVRRYVGAQFDFEIQVIVDRNSMKGMRLGEEPSSRLGWNTWLGQWPFPFDADDAIFQLSDFEPL